MTEETFTPQSDFPADPALTAEAAPDDFGAKLAALEAILFMAAEPIPPVELAEILEVTPARVDDLAAALAELYTGRGLQVTKVAGGYQVATRPEYGPFVAKLHKPERFRLSKASFETLAIIAYKQPVTRPEVDAIRGVNSDSAIETLLQYQLICEAGRKDTPGRPMLYQTTESFLGHFGLNSVSDLPSIDSLPADEDEVRAEVEASLGATAPSEETPDDAEAAGVAETESPVTEAADESLEPTA